MDIHQKPDVSVPDGNPPGELLTEDLVIGDGPEVTAGMQVTVDYVGVSWSTGNEFDASWNRNDTFTFGLGAGQVIEGWDRGVQGMRVGGRRRQRARVHRLELAIEAREPLSILRLRGLGKDAWEGVDAADYVAEERGSWD